MIHNLHANMAEAKAWLILHEISFRQVTRYQLKIGRKISYYPSKETTFVDGEDGARTLTGLRGLEAVLRELGYLADVPETPTFSAF